jgi:hypothetical protein
MKVEYSFNDKSTPLVVYANITTNLKKGFPNH